VVQRDGREAGEVSGKLVGSLLIMGRRLLHRHVFETRGVASKGIPREAILERSEADLSYSALSRRH
jgi:hypothetical protein